MIRGNQKTIPEIGVLVLQVKAEMIREGSRYVEPENKYPNYPRTGKVIKPEFGNLISSLCKKEEKPRPGIQFRGTPGKQTELPELIKGTRQRFLYFGGNNGE
jgi:hypothetical protein